MSLLGKCITCLIIAGAALFNACLQYKLGNYSKIGWQVIGGAILIGIVLVAP
jgi:hypothetical protein